MGFTAALRGLLAVTEESFSSAEISFELLRVARKSCFDGTSRLALLFVSIRDFFRDPCLNLAFHPADASSS